MNRGDTIAAISSATGRAARMILRLSGPDAPTIAAAMIDLPAGFTAGGAFRGAIDLRGMRIPAWIYRFISPGSYTGEDLIEFHIPGNPLLAKLLLEELLRLGARAAEPGEFTARAYFNGRLDLTEAEGVAATISAANEQELCAARQLMSGELARRLRPITDALADTLALLEVGIDFSDEDVTFLPAEQLSSRIASARGLLDQLLADSSRFDRLSHEPAVVLVGRPNAGKSTLLNALAGHERAVVSPIAGTTRDVLSAEIALSRGIIRMMDVAGLYNTPESNADSIDHKMREQALRAVAEADRILLVRDSTDAGPPPLLPREPDIVVWSKADLGSRSLSPEYGGEGTDPRHFHSKACTRQITLSAKTGDGMPTLRQALDLLCFGESSAAFSLALNARHVRAINAALQALDGAAGQIRAGPEFIALELREAIDALGGISGVISPDDLLGRIFSAFCIGK